MKTLLHLDSSPSPHSVSRELTRAYAEAWKASHPEGAVIYRDLTEAPPPPIDGTWIGAAFTRPSERSPEQARTLALSDELIAELEKADEYVIGVAMHNLTIPGVLKLWVDQVVRAGKTFAYTESGPQGFLQGKKATVVVASGGVYAPGTPAAAMNFIEPYLKAILTFVGVTDVRFVAAEGTAKLMSGTVNRPQFLEPALQQVLSAVSA